MVETHRRAVELVDLEADLLRAALTGLTPSEELEALVNEQRLVPRSCLPKLSPEARAMLEEALKGIAD